MKKLLLVLAVVIPVVVLLSASSKKEEPPASHCAPKRFSKGIVACCGLPAFYWDGTQCVDATNKPGKCGCICNGHDGTLGGKDCDAIFDTREACEATYADC